MGEEEAKQRRKEQKLSGKAGEGLLPQDGADNNHPVCKSSTAGSLESVWPLLWKGQEEPRKSRDTQTERTPHQQFQWNLIFTISAPGLNACGNSLETPKFTLPILLLEADQ